MEKKVPCYTRNDEEVKKIGKKYNDCITKNPTNLAFIFHAMKIKDSNTFLSNP